MPKKTSTKATPKKTTTKKTEQKAELMISPNTQVELKLEWAELEEAFQTSLKNLAKKLKIKGFREGKVPAKVAEQKLEYGEIVQNVLQQVVPNKWQKYLEDNKDKIKPIIRPEIETVSTDKGKTWIIKLHFSEAPKIDLKDYAKTVKKAKKLAKDELKKLADHLAKDHKGEEKKITKQQEEDLTLKVIFREIIKEVKPQIQEMLVREQVQYRLQQLTESLKRAQLNIEDYLAKQKIDPKDFLAQLQAEALATLQLEFILAQMPKTAKLEVTASEIKAEVDKFKDEQIKKLYEKEQYYQERLKSSLLRQKVIKHLLEL